MRYGLIDLHTRLRKWGRLPEPLWRCISDPNLTKRGKYMSTHDPIALDGRIKLAREAFAQFGSTDDMDELLRIVHGPGWTTIAEWLMVEGLLESLTAQTRTLMATRQTLMSASKRVGTPQNEAVPAT